MMEERLAKRVKDLEAEVAALEAATALQRTVFVGGVSNKLSVLDVRDFFSACGRVKLATIPRDTSGRPKPFALVEFDDRVGAENALMLNGASLGGRRVQIRLQSSIVHS